MFVLKCFCVCFCCFEKINRKLKNFAIYFEKSKSLYLIMSRRQAVKENRIDTDKDSMVSKKSKDRLKIRTLDY